MPESFKAIKNRIKSVENIRKVTNAMQMISAVKLKRMEKILYGIRSYSCKIDELLNIVAALCPEAEEPLFEKRDTTGKKALLVVTSDNGLCGSYNTGILRAAEEYILRNGRDNIYAIVTGSRGLSYLKNIGIPVQNSYIGLNGKYDRNVADEIFAEIIGLFLEKKVDEVWCAHTSFITAVMLKPIVDKMLPLIPQIVGAREYMTEPVASELLRKVAFESAMVKVRRILSEGFVAEHVSRVVAMKAATDNADELFSNLVLERNKIRQSSITQEMMEIISSAEALKG